MKKRVEKRKKLSINNKIINKNKNKLLKECKEVKKIKK